MIQILFCCCIPSSWWFLGQWPAWPESNNISNWQLGGSWWWALLKWWNQTKPRLGLSPLLQGNQTGALVHSGPGRGWPGPGSRACPPTAPKSNTPLRAQGGRSIAIAKYTNMEVSTNWTKIFLPAFVSKSAFQPGSRSATRSMIGWTCCFVSFRKESGTPRYLQGKSDSWQGRCSCIVILSSSEHWMGKPLLFCTFVLNPKASPKSWRISSTIIFLCYVCHAWDRKECPP